MDGCLNNIRRLSMSWPILALNAAYTVICCDRKSKWTPSADLLQESTVPTRAVAAGARHGATWEQIQQTVKACCRLHEGNLLTQPSNTALYWQSIQGGAKKTGPMGHPISLQIFWKLHDQIPWKLVNFCKIICWTQSLTFCLKISSRCGAT